MRRLILFFLAPTVAALGQSASVGLTVPSWLSLSNSPLTITGATGGGTIGVTATPGETQNQFLATPNGSSGAVGLRAIVGADLPYTAAGANPFATTVAAHLQDVGYASRRRHIKAAQQLKTGAGDCCIAPRGRGAEPRSGLLTTGQ